MSVTSTFLKEASVTWAKLYSKEHVTDLISMRYYFGCINYNCDKSPTDVGVWKENVFIDNWS